MERTKTMERASIMLSAESVEVLGRLRVKLNATSHSDVVRRAIRALDLLLDDSSDVIVRDRATGKETKVIII